MLILGRLAGAAMGAALAVTLALPAAASGKDRVYADSFGNLVVESAAGYKRIIVGQGEHAKALASYTGSDEPRVVYADGEPQAERECYRPPALIKGRSYMYGFDQGEIPFQGGACR